MKMQGAVGTMYAASSARKYQADENGVIDNVHERDLADLVRSGCSVIHPETEKNVEPGSDFSPAHNEEHHEAGDELRK